MDEAKQDPESKAEENDQCDGDCPNCGHCA